MANPLTLVVGATGTVGSEVVKQLVEAGQNVRALARDPGKATKLGGAIDVAFGDLAKPETLSGPFAGAEKVFILAPPVPSMEELEAKQASSMLSIFLISAQACLTTIYGGRMAQTSGDCALLR